MPPTVLEKVTPGHEGLEGRNLRAGGGPGSLRRFHPGPGDGQRLGLRAPGRGLHPEPGPRLAGLRDPGGGGRHHQRCARPSGWTTCPTAGSRPRALAGKACATPSKNSPNCACWPCRCEPSVAGTQGGAASLAACAVPGGLEPEATSPPCWGACPPSRRHLCSGCGDLAPLMVPSGRPWPDRYIAAKLTANKSTSA